MAKVRVREDGKRVYGPYKGSKENGGRPTVRVYDPKTKSGSSTNAARNAKEESLGKELPKDKHVAHKGSSNKPVSPSSTRVESAKKNIGDGNRSRRSGKGR